MYMYVSHACIHMYTLIYIYIHVYIHVHVQEYTCMVNPLNIRTSP